LVAIRARKPCTLLRWRFLGWYVRNMVNTPHRLILFRWILRGSSLRLSLQIGQPNKYIRIIKPLSSLFYKGFHRFPASVRLTTIYCGSPVAAIIIMNYES
jgi:hypothetical protein